MLKMRKCATRGTSGIPAVGIITFWSLMEVHLTILSGTDEQIHGHTHIIIIIIFYLPKKAGGLPEKPKLIIRWSPII